MNDFQVDLYNIVISTVQRFTSNWFSFRLWEKNDFEVKVSLSWIFMMKTKYYQMLKMGSEWGLLHERCFVPKSNLCASYEFWGKILNLPPYGLEQVRYLILNENIEWKSLPTLEIDTLL